MMEKTQIYFRFILYLDLINKKFDNQEKHD